MLQHKSSETPQASAETGAGTGNRTGISQAPEMALALIREAQKTPPNASGDARVLGEYRADYIREMEVLGSRPRPLGQAPAGSAAPLLLDKLGERLAFERQGVRLYEGLIGKAKLLPGMPGGPSLEDLEHILAEERGHFRLLQQAVVEAGGDPTVLTPCANIAAVLSQGVVQIVTDPRTTMVQCLEAILLAELADNDGWNLLRQVALASGAAGLAEQFGEAEAHEQEHLAKVRGWLSASLPGGKPPAKSARPSAASRRAGSRATPKATPKAGSKPSSKPSS